MAIIFLTLNSYSSADRRPDFISNRKPEFADVPVSMQVVTGQGLAMGASASRPMLHSFPDLRSNPEYGSSAEAFENYPNIFAFLVHP
jgi:hypothetical protein